MLALFSCVMYNYLVKPRRGYAADAENENIGKA